MGLPKRIIHHLLQFLAFIIRQFFKWSSLKYLKRANAKAANNATQRNQSKKMRKNANIAERLLMS
jgi:membrane-anchored glycerophosphoryl diester phosphodiesterase (GDPDase)